MTTPTDSQEEIVKGLIAAGDFLKSIISIVENEGVKVVVSAEPKIISIEILDTTNVNIASAIMANINEAFSQNRKKVLENALHNIPE